MYKENFFYDEKQYEKAGYAEWEFGCSFCGKPFKRKDLRFHEGLKWQGCYICARPYTEWNFGKFQKNCPSRCKKNHGFLLCEKCREYQEMDPEEKHDLTFLNKLHRCSSQNTGPIELIVIDEKDYEGIDSSICNAFERTQLMD